MGARDWRDGGGICWGDRAGDAPAGGDGMDRRGGTALLELIEEMAEKSEIGRAHV